MRNLRRKSVGMMNEFGLTGRLKKKEQIRRKKDRRRPPAYTFERAILLMTGDYQSRRLTSEP